MAVNPKGKKSLNIDLPVDLYDFYAKLCIDWGMTKTEGIVQYLRYLKSLSRGQREALNEESPKTFKPNARKPR